MFLGVCEVSNYQIGQRALVTAASTRLEKELRKRSESNASIIGVSAKTTTAVGTGTAGTVSDAKGDKKKKTDTTDTTHTIQIDSTDTVRKSTRTLLIGDSTVEWFARILDPDGESGGDIVGAGRVAYATRESDVRSL